MSTRNDGAPIGDGERDAWLREALRHAPDANAAPPRDLSETILAQARAAARVGGAPARAARRRNPVVALWDWLARPPVAAGFASLMAATLVGLMWWDRPMDETLPPRPEVARQRAQSSPPADVGEAAADTDRIDPASPANNAIVSEARAPVTAVPAAPPVPSVGAIAPAPQPARQQRREDTVLRDDKAAANAKATVPKAASPPPPGTGTTEAKEQQRKLEAANDAAPADRAAAKPSPFPRGDEERAAVAAAPARKLDSDAKDGKASDRAVGAAPADALAARDALAKSKSTAATPTAPAEALRSEPPAAFAEKRANEVAQTSPTTGTESEAAKRSRAAGAMSQPTPATAAAPAMQAAAPAPSAAPSPLRDSASVEPREKQASAFAASRAPQVQSELAAAQRGGAAATPLAPILAAIASDPSRWSRSTAAGSVVALEAGWRDWLAQLDTAARGRWQPAGAANGRERDAATTLRLVDGGRTTAVVRLDGTTVRVDAIERGERWQAALAPAAAEQLRAAAERLAR